MSLLARYRRAKMTVYRGCLGPAALIIVLAIAIAGCSSSANEPEQEEVVVELDEDNSLVTTGDPEPIR